MPSFVVLTGAFQYLYFGNWNHEVQQRPFKFLASPNLNISGVIQIPP